MTTTLIDWQPGQQARHNGHVVTLITFPTSAGYTPARLRHRCSLKADCRRWDVDGGTGFAWECELVEIVEQPTADSDAFQYVGAEMPWTSPDGHVTIVVRRGHFAWTVETYQGTLRVADNCGSYASEAEARMVARGYATMYRAETTPAADRQPQRSTRIRRHSPKPSVLAALNLADANGRIWRGGQPGQARSNVLIALADAGRVTLTWRQGPHGRRIEYATIKTQIAA